MDVFTYMYIYTQHMPVCMYVCIYIIYIIYIYILAWKRTTDPLELKFQLVVSKAQE